MNETYESYKKARDMAWQILLKSNTKSLPVNLNYICKFLNVKTSPYSKFSLLELFRPEVISGDGFTFDFYGEKFIVYNDKKPIYRQRFTVAHEIGHIALDHKADIIHYRIREDDSKNGIKEIQANVFARDLLMPATVLAGLNVHTPEEIMKICNVSYESAKKRALRLEQLYKKDMFNKHPVEKQIYNQFKQFIESKNNKIRGI